MMKYFLLPFVFAVGLICGCYIAPPYSNGVIDYSIPLSPLDKMDICFTPSMKCLPLIQKTLQEAQESIHVQSYSLTSKPIANALVEASQKGIHIEIISDFGQSKSRYSQIPFLKDSGIPIWIDDQINGIHHNKIMIIDHSKVICGSYNFSEAAEKRNCENLLIIHSPKIAQQYMQNWEEDLARIQSKLNNKSIELDELKLRYNDIENQLTQSMHKAHTQKELFQKAYSNLNSILASHLIDKEDAFKTIKTLTAYKKLNESELSTWNTALKKIYDQTELILQKKDLYEEIIEQFLKPVVSSISKKRSSHMQLEEFTPSQRTSIRNFIIYINNEIYNDISFIRGICNNKLSYVEDIISF